MGCPARLGHNEAMNPIIRCLAMAAMGLCLSACKPPVAHVPPPAPGPSPQERLAAIDMAAGVDDTELDVQPLRDPRIGDLREHAAQARVRGDAGAAAAALDQALQLAPDDPTVLQERAEAALLQGDYAAAGTLARRAWELGSRVGPMCRRHWATIEQAALANSQADSAVSAREQIGTCTVPGIKRM